eukprot:scaffold11702_cov157-Skeletonema_dohrnii-CCMP3373.AAC.2
MNKRINEYEAATGKTVTLDMYSNFSRDHKGECYRNSKYNPASAEEYQATDAARELLIDDDGNYRGDDTAIFCGSISADNDTRSPNNFIRAQADIIGDAADGKAEHDPDKGHVMKNTNNDIYDLREKNPSLKGTRALSNVRIKSLHTDIRDPLEEYNKEGVGNAAARCKCLKQIGAIVYHHSGDHSKCFQEKYCTFIKVKNANPTWSDEKVDEEASKQSKRHCGKYMSIGKDAIAKITERIAKTFNPKSIDRIARCGNSNAAEAFFGSLVKLTEGKRINLDQADTWNAQAHLCVANAGKGNKQKTHYETAALLGVEVNAVEILHMKKTTKKRETDSARLNGENAKNQRTRTSLMKASIMGKESQKKTCHKSGKVSTSESAQTNNKKKAAVRRCGNCRQPGHTVATCSMPKVTKRKPDQKWMNWDHECGEAPPSKKFKLIDW